MAQNILSLIFTVIIFLIVFGVFTFAIFWILGKFGLWKWATYRKLKRRFKDTEFLEEHIAFCNNAIEKKWRYKDILRFIKYEKDGSKLLYTFLVMEELKKNERRL